MIKAKIIKVISLLIFLLLSLGALSFASYMSSKRTAEQFVGKTLQRYPLSHAIITIAPFERRDLVWRLRFSNPDPHVFDDEFEIYTTVIGKIVITNPRDLGVRLTKLENSEVQSNSIKVRNAFELEQIKKQQIIHERGVSLFKSSHFYKTYSEHFTITDVEFQEHSKSKVFFNGQEWRATLTPKKKYPFSCKVMAVFPVKDNKIESSITPVEIENAFDKCFSHHYVKKHMSGTVVAGIRLHITGDRLHWYTADLQELLFKLKGAETDIKELKNWARIYIDAEYQRYVPLFLNSITGELIYKEDETICSPPILIPGELIEPKQTMQNSHIQSFNIAPSSLGRSKQHCAS